MLLHVPPPVEVSIQEFVFFRSARLFCTESFLTFSDTSSGYTPNTHGHMVPWDPPLFGIPDEVMGELVSTLIKEVIRVASIVGEKTDDESRQSSPQSDTSSLPAVATKNNKVFRFRKGSRRH